MIEIVLDQTSVVPGGTVSGRAVLSPSNSELGRKVELSVLWETEGKGDTDMGVVFHEVLADGDPVRARGEHRFEQRLPLLPVSYTGTLIKVRWLVRARRCHILTNDFVVDEEFVVGWS